MSTEAFTRATKIQEVINAIKTQEAVFQAGHWSSAEIFENRMRADGFVSPVPISHKYKFPPDMDEKQCEDMAMWLTYIIFFDPLRIYEPEKYVNNMLAGTNITDQEKQKLYNKQIKITGNLDATEQEQIVTFFKRAQQHAMSDFAKLARNLKKLNPEVADIQINEQSFDDLYNLVIGMTSRFHPDDIKYFMSLNDIETARQTNHKLGGVLGYEPNMFMAPNRVTQIVNSIIMQRNFQHAHK